MSERRMPTIRTARAITKQGNLEGCIVIGFDADGHVGGASYGASVAQCRQLGAFLDWIIDTGLQDGPSLSLFTPSPAARRSGP